MLYGMSAQEFWYEDTHLVVAYRELSKLRTERKNQEMWLQGLYFLDALSASLSGFRKAGSPPYKYPQEPYDILGKKREEEEREPTEEEKAEARQKIIDQLNAWKKAWENSNAERRDD